jgi:hypothetical protein
LQIEKLEDRNLLSFQVLGTLGTQVALPTGTAFRINDFEPDAMNNRGDIVYGDDLGTANDPSTFFGEGVFLRDSHGQETVLGSSTAPAPGGVTFGSSGFEGPATLNAQGDAAVDFLLQPAASPFGVNSGAFRYLHSTGTVSAVVLPGTPAPAGGTFQGVSFGPALDNRGDLYFAGIIPTAKGVQVPDNPGLGIGVFEADRAGHITSVVSPGDPAPGGGTFDDAGETYGAGAWVNGRGDIAFVGHVAGEEALVPGFGQPDFFATLGSVYVKSGRTGQITSVAHAGDPAPGGGVFRQALFPGINDRGDIVITGDLTPAPDVYQHLGVFLYSDGKIVPVARPGDLMPGGTGHLFSASGVNGNTHVNNRGDVVFNATLDTSTGGVADTGLYQWSHGQLSVIARTGTVIPGVGTIAAVTNPSAIVIGPPTGVFPTSGAVNNDRGQIIFAVTLTSGTGVMLLFTPGHEGDEGGDDGGHGDGGSDAPGRGDAPEAVLQAAHLAPVVAASAASQPHSPDAALAAAVPGTVVSPPLGHAAALAVQGASRAVLPPAPGAGRDSGTVPAPSAHPVTGLTGALGHRAVGAFFARLGSSPLADPFANGPF